MISRKYKITFYVPEVYAEKVKNAMFQAGAGRIGNYCQCAWQVLGQGQFMPLEGNHAFIGETNKLEYVAEYRVEMVCEHQFLQKAVDALKISHPYEEPAYNVLSLVDV